MEIGILILLIIVILILLFSGIHQRSTFRQTETRLQNKLLKKIEEVNLLQRHHHQTETRLQNKLLKKIEEVNLLQRHHHQTETRLRDTLLEKIEEVEHLLKQYHTSTLFNYQDPWWKDYSWLYRHVRDWQCEECQLSLNLDRQYLHTHHIWGTHHNDPNDLMALCIACHAKQPGTNHHRLTATEDFDKFMEKYGAQWRLLRGSPPLISNQ